MTTRLAVSYFNWMWQHSRLKTTAAQRAGLTTRLWNWHDIATYPDIQEQPKKDRVIRDSFTLPFGGYDLIAAIRQRCLGSAVNLTKSEVIRA